MYDLSKELLNFYNDCVVLRNEKQQELRKKRDLNLSRLKKGLEEYNADNDTKYKICETRTQGSMAMHTIVQNDNNDYDIDVAIVFEKDNLCGKGPYAIKKIIANALKRKCQNFAEDPEIKTNCVRIVYSDGYHVDFAIYRRFKENESDKDYKYEHAGSEWMSRNPAAINEWFANEVQNKGKTLRKIVRLSKMFCKSRSEWKNMPGGLIQTVLCTEKFQDYERLDEAFYYTMKEIKKRLEDSIEIFNPTDSSLSLLQTDIHRQKVRNWSSRLENKLKKLDILFDENCTQEDAENAWYEFFNHDYWKELAEKESLLIREHSYYSYDNTEEFIEDLYDVDEQYHLKINCTVKKRGFRDMSIFNYLKIVRRLAHGFSIECPIESTNAPSYDLVLWKVRNIGEIAEKRNMIRGQILDRGNKIKETSNFYGSHYIECYLIKNNICVAIGHVDIPIDDH